MRVIHLVALIFGSLTTLSALIALTGVNGGWLQDSFTTCGTIQCCARDGSGCVSFDTLFAGTGSSCALASAGKAVEALAVIAFVLCLVALILVIVRFIGVVQEKSASLLAGTLFIFALVLFIVNDGVYLGVYLGSCCNNGCSADGGYALAFNNIAILLAYPSFILLFVRPGEGSEGTAK